MTFKYYTEEQKDSWVSHIYKSNRSHEAAVHKVRPHAWIFWRRCWLYCPHSYQLSVSWEFKNLHLWLRIPIYFLTRHS